MKGRGTKSEGGDREGEPGKVRGRKYDGGEGKEVKGRETRRHEGEKR